MFHKGKKIILSSIEKNIIVHGEWLTDMHMEYFAQLIQNCSDYRPVETWRIQCPDTIYPVPENKKHIQILHSSSSLLDGHWVCSYYDTKNIFIYDSLNNKKIHTHHEIFLKRLFPTYPFNNCPVKFPTVQGQLNSDDCGVFAIAFAVLLLYNIKPEKIKYDHNLMRSHLIKIFESNIIEHFPQDEQYGPPQKVLPLAVVRTREIEAARLRSKRRCESKQKRSIRLDGIKNAHISCNIDLSNNILLEDINNSTKNLDNMSDNNCFLEKNNIELKVSNITNNGLDNCVHKRILYETNADLNYKEEQRIIDKRVYYVQNKEKICAKKRYQYQKNLENNRDNKRRQYQKNIDNNRAKKRRQYEKNVENDCDKKRRQYKEDIENNRSKKRRRYEENVENNRANKQCRYVKNIESNRTEQVNRYKRNIQNNRAKQRYQYKKNCIKRRAQKRKSYSINLQRERERQNKLSRKWYYNKKYYEKKKQEKENINAKFNVKNHNFSTNIIKKYKKFRLRNSIKIVGSFHTFVKIISEKLDIKGKIEKDLEAEKIVRWCMHIRDSYLCDMKKILVSLKKKSETCLTLVAECSVIEDKRYALCGISRHTASSENYFVDSTYCKETLSQALAMNMEGQVVNVLPLIPAQAKKSWSCSTLCDKKLEDPILIERYQKFLESVNTCTLKNLPKLIKNIHKCTIKTSDIKMGHAQSCYIDYTLCKAMFLPIQLLSPHFPKVRNIRRFIYQLGNLYQKMLDLDTALICGDLDTLNKIVTVAQEKADLCKHQQSDTILSDDDIFSKYKNAFKILKKRAMDIPRYVCVSCERLCYKRNVSNVDKVKANLDIPVWRDLMAHVEKEKINPQYICDYCKRKFYQGLMPAYCILNNLVTNHVPEVISSLNKFEKILVQRAKAFQTVLKMGTVINKKLPQRQMVQKVKGRTFHLPLPLQETLNKLCSNTDPININHELYILVRGIPTKSKIIWEEMVDLKKVFNALTWLKDNNHLYFHIILPNTYDDLNLEKLNNLEFQIQETETVQETENFEEAVLVEKHELLNNKSKLQIQSTENVEPILDQRQALLTPVTDSDENDGYYEQYTIYPLYEKKDNKSATALYQMLKVHDLPLDNREKYLDLLCFPDLYPFGVNGQHENRQVKLHSHEFIKCRLQSKHAQYRLNQQYLFYLLNDANNRQLSRGIYHKLNVTNPRDRYTAAEYLEAMSKDLLESNLSTIFSTLRNTEQYWRRPRYDLNCMTQHYGPATWFLTLSPAEWLWEELGEYIREVNGWHDSSLPTSVLVARDPVSTSRFVDNKFHAILDFICSKDHPLGEVAHYFWRREYQGRGIQHFHMLIWIKDAPILGESSIEEISKFILQHISCKIPNKNISPLLYRRVNTHQLHKHNDYCLRSKKVGRKVTRRCRFGFPRPVTETLNIRDVATSIAGRKHLKHRSRLYDLPRKDDEVNINDYNPILLTAWEGNMDIQFIGEKSSILTWYITKYMNKAAKCELSDSIVNSKNSNDKPLGSFLWNIALRFTNNRECGALEAADTLLGISLHGTDRNTTIKWLDVNQIRHRKLKTREEIEALEADSTDIFCASLIDNHYPNRPEELECTSLYEFAKWYDITRVEPRSDIIEYYKLNKDYYLKRRQRECLINHYRYNVNVQPENYFFSLLVMFKPWRKLEDLRDGCDTYAESFHKVKLHLVEALQYHEKLEELQKAFEAAKELIQQKLDEVQKQNVSQDDPENPIGIQNIEAGEAMQDFKDLGDKIVDIDVSQMITNLNTDQRRVFDRVIDTIRSDKSVLRLYVSGEGGTGKSFLIKTIKCWIKQNLNKDTAVGAPTGIAAFNIDGLTVHRLLQLPVEHGQTPKYKQVSDHVLKVLRAQLKDVILFVIDEVSMISNLTLMYIHLRLSQIFDTSDCDDGWFGQKHILLFGDLLQLSPVLQDPAFAHLSKEKIGKYFGSLGTVNLWITLFEYDELTINMRQKEDETYRKLLSRIRIGLLTKSDCEILEKRRIHFNGDSVDSRLNELCNFIDNLPSDTVCLFPTCHMCDTLNAAMLSRIASKEILLIAEDAIECVPYLKKKVLKVLSNNDDDNSRTAGLSKSIAIKIGAKVMIRRNIDVTLGLVNGTIATVISVIQDPSSEYIEKIKLLLPSGLEYVIERVSVKFEVIDKAYVVRKQFPLSLSYGITVHKSQGLSLHNVVVDIGNSVFSHGQSYVALSRVTSLEGLHLINYDPSSIKASEGAIIEYNRLKQIHKPDAEIIVAPQEKYYKVKDKVWALPKIVSSVQESHEKVRKDTAWVMRGFQNKDEVSCYANAVLQCLLHLYSIRKQLHMYDKSSVLYILAHRYENGMQNLNTYAIRQYLGEHFLISVKQDASQFLTTLCAKVDYIKSLVQHQITCVKRCKNCNNTKTIIDDNNILLSISIDNLKKKSYDLNDLLNLTLSHWRESKELCENCTSNDMLFKKELTITREIIIVHLALFSPQNGTLIKRNKINLRAVPTTKVLVKGQLYKVMNAIFHHGRSVEEGHYTSICREESGWIEVDDVQI